MTYFGVYHDQEVGLSKDWTSFSLEFVIDAIVYKVDQLEDVTPQTYAAVFDMSRLEGDKMIANLHHDETGESTLRVCVADVTHAQMERLGIEHTVDAGNTIVLGTWKTVR